jgi:hypothetical protein
MSLVRLATALAADPSIRRALAAADAGEAQVDIALATGARPVFVAALAGAGGSGGPESAEHDDGTPGAAAPGAPAGTPPAAGAPILVVAATGREAEDMVTALRAASCRPRRSSHLPSWETLPTSGSHPAPTPSGGAWPCCAGGPPGSRTTRHTGRCASSSRRAGGAAAPGPRAGRPRAGGAARPATNVPLDEVVEALVAAAYTRTDLVERAASSPSAAASSTSSRRPRNTRCGWSSGATRSRRSGGSGSPTSAAWRWPRVGCGRRRAASCCSPTRSGRGRRDARRQLPGVADLLDQGRRGHRGRGHGVAAAGARRRRCRPLLDVLPAGVGCSCATPSGSGCAPRPGRHERGVPRRPLVQRGAAGARRPDRPARRPRRRAPILHASRELRSARPRARYAVVDLLAVRRRRAGRLRRRRPTR